ncbi:hypothetical protein D8X85_03055 [Listeria seeligeri]|uniref:hypothetical protein n=1 Tax=Listeria seeligeri TaxID=1640 RepID=UPI00194590B0|nr:hypothetical protein [Listeria seeligeri]MBM5604518.1 hypothetical protein [Listeria seeligeri]MBM5676197.1 hypothetical protein [Listeria seeligeri]
MYATYIIGQVSFTKIFEIFIPVMISLLICFLTIRSTNKQNKKSMKQQEQQYQETLVESEKRYQEQLLIAERKERLSYLPYLSILPGKEINKFAGKMEQSDNNVFLIPCKVINEGMGAAFSVHLKYIRKKEIPKEVTTLSVVAFNAKDKNEYDVLGVSSPIDKDILRVEDQTDFHLNLHAVDGDSRMVAPSMCIEWHFEIEFLDFLDRKYLQKYRLYTSTNFGEVQRINSDKPRLIEE